MPRTCTICSHVERAAIEAAAVSGTPYRSIAKQFRCSEAAMYRHVSEHIQETVKQSQAAVEEVRGLDVVKQLQAINGVALSVLRKSIADEKPELALKAGREVLKQLEFQAKLLGDIDKPTVNIYVTVEWQMIRATIVQALMPYQDARLAVAAALREMEGSRDRLN